MSAKIKIYIICFLLFLFNLNLNPLNEDLYTEKIKKISKSWSDKVNDEPDKSLVQRFSIRLLEYITKVYGNALIEKIPDNITAREFNNAFFEEYNQNLYVAWYKSYIHINAINKERLNTKENIVTVSSDHFNLIVTKGSTAWENREDILRIVESTLLEGLEKYNSYYENVNLEDILNTLKKDPIELFLYQNSNEWFQRNKKTFFEKSVDDIYCRTDSRFIEGFYINEISLKYISHMVYFIIFKLINLKMHYYTRHGLIDYYNYEFSPIDKIGIFNSPKERVNQIWKIRKKGFINTRDDLFHTPTQWYSYDYWAISISECASFIQYILENYGFYELEEIILNKDSNEWLSKKPDDVIKDWKEWVNEE